MRRESLATRSRFAMVVAGLLVVLMGITACSRLSFVRPSVERKGFERTAPEVNIRTDDRKPGTSTAARRLISQGQQLLTQGDLPGARQAAQQAVKLAPASALAHTLLALVEDRNGKAAIAGRHYLQATELAPTQGAMLNNYGTWLCSQGREPESLEWFDRALADRAYASPAVALANGGACAYRAGNAQRAAPYLARAIEIDPVNPVALGAMAELEFRAGNAFRARAFSQRRLAAAPADAAALMLASQIEEKLGDKKASARYVQQLREQFPAAPETEPGDPGDR